MSNYNSNDPYNRHGNRHETQDNKSGSGKAVGIAFAAILIVGVAAAGFYLVDVDQTKEARLPNVDVSVEKGQMPAYDVDVAEVNMTQEEVEVDVDVPTMDVQTETKTIEIEVPVDVEAGKKTETVTVPSLDVERPEADSPNNDADTQ